MTGFDASEQALLATGTRLSELETEIQQSFAPLRQEAEALLGGGWSGGAAQSFAQGWQQWLTGYNESMQTLAEMGQLLRTTGHGYGTAEHGSTTVINSSGSGPQ